MRCERHLIGPFRFGGGAWALVGFSPPPLYSSGRASVEEGALSSAAVLAACGASACGWSAAASAPRRRRSAASSGLGALGLSGLGALEKGEGPPSPLLPAEPADPVLPVPGVPIPEMASPAVPESPLPLDQPRVDPSLPPPPGESIAPTPPGGTSQLPSGPWPMPAMGGWGPAPFWAPYTQPWGVGPPLGFPVITAGLQGAAEQVWLGNRPALAPVGGGSVTLPTAISGAGGTSRFYPMGILPFPQHAPYGAMRLPLGDHLLPAVLFVWRPPATLRFVRWLPYGITWALSRGLPFCAQGQDTPHPVSVPGSHTKGLDLGRGSLGGTYTVLLSDWGCHHGCSHVVQRIG
ncbi:formin-2-like isoform X1 [Hemicordylus capensis]|uniref:formin-2-like isoform X1 n=1 Tax=Hemicordylus capensis TaxID=884348 RepID=UPI0023027C37|nr:formin-2-like isoform X1 [Hemicordylus capensis]